MTRFIIHKMDTAVSRWLDVPVPDGIFVVARDITGQEFLHEPRVMPFDRGHDWSVWSDGRIRVSPGGGEWDPLWLVLQYGPYPTCCGRELAQGSRFCPMCGVKTSGSMVQAG